jgi:carboxypeptidase Taq
VPSETYVEFIGRVREIGITESIANLLDWDQETYMPPKATRSRADQMKLIARVSHEKMLDDGFRQLLEAVEQEEGDDPIVATNVREVRRVYDRKVKIPTSLVEAVSEAGTLGKEAWAKARAESRFDLFAPHLEKLLDLKRKVAERIGYDTEPYDALMDEFEPGAKAAEVERVFAELKGQLVPLVEAIQAAPSQPDASILERAFPVAAQADFARRVAELLGFDFRSGRIDTAVHPFCTSCSPLDVRLTTRYGDRYLPMSLFGTMHEVGHALYEQGLDPQHAHTPMGDSISLGIHESQSRLWENMVGRSRAFWTHLYPSLQRDFASLADVSLDAWLRAINAVRPSLIRVEADEVTYNLHIMLRFDLERRLLEGEIRVPDVPEAWNEGMRALLSCVPETDAEGCLQDIHWSMGVFGYFPTYALGNLYAAQFFDAAQREMPNLADQIRKGQLQPLRDWLRDRIHRHGKRYRAGELVEVVTGASLSHGPFVEYLNRKYRPLYGLGAAS